MKRDRVGLALLALIVGLVLAGGATAGSAAHAAPWATLAHGGSAAHYLSSIGVDPKGVVVQRGHHNYAGPKCPGKGWTCTKSHHVLQFTTAAGGSNSVSCAGGTSNSSSDGSSQTCTIVQISTSGSNNATCTEQSSTTSAGTVSQTCVIQQTSGSGADKATVTQTALQGPSACSPPSDPTSLQSQTGSQAASITQLSSNGNGTASVSQTVTQCASMTTTGPASQSQATSQTFTIQQGPVGFDPANPNCANSQGSLTATATQGQHQRGYATKASSGTQNQHADLIGHIDQCSTSNAQYTATQTEDQFLAPNSAVSQTQVGPTRLNGSHARVHARRTLLRGACCSFQGTNGSDKCTITQTTNQSANANAVQTEQLTTTVGTSGNCSGNISATQNGVTNSASQSGSNVDKSLSCQSQVCTGASIPTSLAWSGDTSGTYHDAATLAATLTRTDTNAPVSGQTVTLGVGAEGCQATTDANGIAACSPSPILGDTPGPYQASATFAGTAVYVGSTTGPLAFTVNKAPTALTYTGDTQGNYHDTVNLSGTLAEAHHTGTPIVGRSVTFAISGDPSQTCTATTDSSGAASCKVKLTADPGSFNVTASFDGSSDADYLSSDTGAGRAFTIHKAPTSLSYTGITTANYHDTVTLSGKLTEADTGDAIAGKTVTFAITPDPHGTQSCTATTLADGTASCNVYLTADPGSFNAAATFDGTNDVDFLSSTSPQPQTFTVNQAPTVLTYSGDLSQDWNDSTTLSAQLTELDTGAVVPNKSVTFTITNGTSSQTCTATTNANGNASCSFVLTLAPGPYTVTAGFSGDIDYLSDTDAHAYTVTREESVVVYTGATTGDYSDPVTLRGVLTGDVAGGTPLAGRQLKFTLGSKSCTGTTNSSGVASCTLNVGDPAGPYSVTASFAGDTYYQASSGSKSFTVTTEETSLSYTGATSGKRGTSATLSARLSSDDGGISGRTINFTLGSLNCSGTTNASGVASCNVTLGSTTGTFTVNASFAGDSYFEAKSTSVSFRITS